MRSTKYAVAFVASAIMVLGVWSARAHAADVPNDAKILKAFLDSDYKKDPTFPWKLGYQKPASLGDWSKQWDVANKALGHAPDVMWKEFTVSFNKDKDGNTQYAKVIATYRRNGVTKGPYTLSALTAFMYFDKVSKLPDAATLRAAAIEFINQDTSSLFESPKVNVAVINIKEFNVQTGALNAISPTELEYNVKIVAEFAVRDMSNMKTRRIALVDGSFTFTANKGAEGAWKVVKGSGGVNYTGGEPVVEKPAEGDYLAVDYAPLSLCKFEDVFQKRKVLDNVDKLNEILGK